MTKETISNHILKKIKKKNIKPKPRWEFLLKNYIFWGAFIISIIIGGITSSVAIFRIIKNDWNIAGKLGYHPVIFGFKTMPFFWLIILTIFIFIAYYNFKHTKKGYKFRLPLTIIASILMSIILGFAFLGAGVAKKMDEQAMEHVPFYREFNFENRLEMWSEIDKGVLGGEIIKIGENYIEIENFKGKKWMINIENLPEKFLNNLKEGMVIGIIGEKTGRGEFKAEEIHPWKGNFMKSRRINHLPMKEMKLSLKRLNPGH